MAGTELRLKSEPRLVERLPFASESGLQRFVKEHAKDLLGLKVVAVAERGGGTISKIDVMAIDRSGQPWIIECKHDLVNRRAVDQLKRYRSAILRRCPTIRKIVGGRFGSIRLQNHPQPRLLTIGYRYAPDLVSAKGITHLGYRYHGIEFTAQKFQTRSVGQVSLYRVAPMQVPTQPHPRVSKTDGTLKRLDAVDRMVAASFRDIHGTLTTLADVEVSSNKNIVRYRTARGVFATATIWSDGVKWRFAGGTVATLRTPADTPELMKTIRTAHAARANTALEPSARRN